MSEEKIFIETPCLYYDKINMNNRCYVKGAFEESCNKKVPVTLEFDDNYIYDDPDKVIGHAELENRDDYVYSYLTLNNTEEVRRYLKDCGIGIYANKVQFNERKDDSKRIITEITKANIQAIGLTLTPSDPDLRIKEDNK